MKRTILMAGFLSGLLALGGCRKSEKAAYQVADIYFQLRQKILTLDPETMGLHPSPSNRVWGVLMETGYPDAVVTLVMIADGTVSLYFSTGGGIIGVGEQEGPRRACHELLSAAPQFLRQAEPAREFPLPQPGHTRFYFLTFDGAFTADALEEDLRNNRLPLSPLSYKAQDVITEVRLAHEKTKAG